MAGTIKKKIFVVDDEADIQDILKINLTRSNYDVHAFSSAEEASGEIKKTRPDLIVLDIMMSGMDGLEFCKEIRNNPEYKNIPIIFLSAKGDVLDRVLGLELGADDYVAKPFSISELISRIKAVLRRAGKGDTGEGVKGIITYKGLTLNPENYSLKVDGKEVRLTKTEFEILTLFLRYPEKIFTRDNIIDSIRGNDVYVIDRTIDVHIMNLRKKLGNYKNVITTISGVGYGFRE